VRSDLRLVVTLFEIDLGKQKRHCHLAGNEMNYLPPLPSEVPWRPASAVKEEEQLSIAPIARQVPETEIEIEGLFDLFVLSGIIILYGIWRFLRLRHYTQFLAPISTGYFAWVFLVFLENRIICCVHSVYRRGTNTSSTVCIQLETIILRGNVRPMFACAIFQVIGRVSSSSIYA